MEMIFQYIWKNRMLGRHLTTVGGRQVDVLRTGVLNTDSGPDFRDARLRIDGEEWAGNVEVHVKASDWYAHGHHLDRAYDNVILHIVSNSDREVTLPGGRVIPQVEVSFPDSFTRMYMVLARKIDDVRCVEEITSIPGLLITDWLTSLGIERMQRKADDIAKRVAALGGDWQTGCLVALARGLGFSINADPMEMLVRSIPFNYLMRHSDDIFQLEALLFGQAGMLDPGEYKTDSYYQRLWREYMFLARKYDLRPLPPGIWKYGRTRPQNFPHRRIAFLARMLEGGFSLLSDLTEKECDPEEIRMLFRRPLAGYWESHFSFGHEGTLLPLNLSRMSEDLLLINFAAPMIYAAGERRGDREMADRGVALWEGLAPESNRYITAWQKAGLPVRNAFESQALIQLRKEYCDRDRCLECRLGHHLLRREMGCRENYTAPGGVN